jgi:hypothetical protein
MLLRRRGVTPSAKRTLTLGSPYSARRACANCRSNASFSFECRRAPRNKCARHILMRCRHMQRRAPCGGCFSRRAVSSQAHGRFALGPTRHCSVWCPLVFWNRESWAFEGVRARDLLRQRGGWDEGTSNRGVVAWAGLGCAVRAVVAAARFACVGEQIANCIGGRRCMPCSAAACRHICVSFVRVGSSRSGLCRSCRYDHPDRGRNIHYAELCAHRE